MKRKFALLVLLLTGGLAAGGEYLDLTWMYNLAVIEFGLMGLIGGVFILIKGKATGAAAGMSRWYGESKYTERHTGIQARMIGIVVVMGSLIFITMSTIDLTTTGGIASFWDDYLRSPQAWGLVVGIAGLLVTLTGLVRAKSGSGAAPGAYNRWRQSSLAGAFSPWLRESRLSCWALFLFSHQEFSKGLWMISGQKQFLLEIRAPRPFGYFGAAPYDRSKNRQGAQGACRNRKFEPVLVSSICQQKNGLIRPFMREKKLVDVIGTYSTCAC